MLRTKKNMKGLPASTCRVSSQAVLVATAAPSRRGWPAEQLGKRAQHSTSLTAPYAKPFCLVGPFTSSHGLFASTFSLRVVTDRLRRDCGHFATRVARGTSQQGQHSTSLTAPFVKPFGLVGPFTSAHPTAPCMDSHRPPSDDVHISFPLYVAAAIAIHTAASVSIHNRTAPL